MVNPLEQAYQDGYLDGVNDVIRELRWVKRKPQTNPYANVTIQYSVGLVVRYILKKISLKKK